MYCGDLGKKQMRKSLGAFDHLPPHLRFDAAKAAAEDLNKHVSQGGSTQEVSVRQACQRYLENLRGKGREATAKDAQGRFERLVYGSSLAAVSLRKLTSAQLRNWRKHLIDRPVVVNPHAEKPQTRKRSPASVNRDMTCLRAALNLALDEGGAASDTAWWSALRPTEGAGARRTLFLDQGQRAALVQHAESDIGLFLKGLSMLPLRPDALSNLTVASFSQQLGVLTIGKDKSGEARKLTVPLHMVAFFKQLAKNKTSAAPLFSRADGSAWNKYAWKKPIKAAAAAAELPAETTAYTLRHSVITDLIVNGLDIMTVARMAGTGLGTIDKHYGHLRMQHAADALAKLAI